MCRRCHGTVSGASRILSFSPASSYSCLYIRGRGRSSTHHVRAHGRPAHRVYLMLLSRMYCIAVASRHPAGYSTGACGAMHACTPTATWPFIKRALSRASMRRRLAQERYPLVAASRSSTASEDERPSRRISSRPRRKMSVASATADQRPDEGGFGHVVQVLYGEAPIRLTARPTTS